MAVTRIGAGAGAMNNGLSAATYNGPSIATSDANTIAVVAVVISVASSSTATTCAVTYGGTAMTELVLSLQGTGTARSAVGFYYLFNPGTGTKSVVVTPGGASTKAGLITQAVAFSGVIIGGVGAAQVTTGGTSHTVTSETNGYALRMLTTGSTPLSSPSHTNEYLNGQSVGGAGDTGCLQSAAGAASVAFTCGGILSTPVSVGTSLAPAPPVTDWPDFAAAGTRIVGAASRTTEAPNVPAGLVPDDIVLVSVQTQGNASLTVTPAANFTLKGTAVGTNECRTHVFWKRQTSATGAGETTGTYAFPLSATPTWSHSRAFRYTGCITTGDPVDAVDTKTSGGSPSFPNTSLTTTVVNTLLVYIAESFAGLVLATFPSGFTTDVVGETADNDGGQTVCSKGQAAIGSTGTLTATLSASNNNEKTVWLGALKPPAGAAAPVAAGRAINLTPPIIRSSLY